MGDMNGWPTPGNPKPPGGPHTYRQRVPAKTKQGLKSIQKNLKQLQGELQGQTNPYPGGGVHRP